MGTISGCRHFKVNLKAKIYIYVNSTTQRCPNKIITNFSDWRLFPFATGVAVLHLEPRISLRLFEKIRYGRNGILGCLGGNWFMKKTGSRKFRDTVLFKWFFPLQQPLFWLCILIDRPIYTVQSNHIGWQSFMFKKTWFRRKTPSFFGT